MQNTKLTQPQREALINLLALGMYVDSLLTLKEDDALNAQLEATDWDSGVGRTVFLQDAITRASRADTDQKAADYLLACVVSFDTAEAKHIALNSLTSYLKVDGMASAEAPFLFKVRNALGI